MYCTVQSTSEIAVIVRLLFLVLKVKSDNTPVFCFKKPPPRRSEAHKHSTRRRVIPDRRFVRETQATPAPPHRCSHCQELKTTFISLCMEVHQVYKDYRRRRGKAVPREERDTTFSRLTSTSTLCKLLKKHCLSLSEKTQKRILLEGNIIAESRTATEHVQVAFESHFFFYIVNSMQSFAIVQHDHFVKLI